MTEMPSRYDYRTLLLSYVMSGMMDGDERVQRVAVEGMERIGRRHEEEERERERKEVGGGGNGKKFFAREAEQIQMGCDAELPRYPRPFTERPCAGSRTLIREHFSRVYHAILAEMRDREAAEQRRMAVGLLRNCLLFAEGHCTKVVEEVVRAVGEMVGIEMEVNGGDEESTSICLAMECCYLIGRFVYPSVWIEVVSEVVAGEMGRKAMDPAVWMGIVRHLVRGWVECGRMGGCGWVGQIVS